MSRSNGAWFGLGDMVYLFAEFNCNSESPMSIDRFFAWRLGKVKSMSLNFKYGVVEHRAPYRFMQPPLKAPVTLGL